MDLSTSYSHIKKPKQNTDFFTDFFDDFSLIESF